VAETPEKEPQAETLNKETQLDKEPVVLNGRSSRMWAIVVSVSALVVIGAAAKYALPNFNIALPNFSSFAEIFPRAAASVPIPDPVTAALKDIQSSQQKNADTLQENGTALQQNTAMLQQGAATLESLRQGFTAQQTNLKTISNQLSSLIARVDSLQNAVAPLTTSSIPQPDARARLVRTSRKKTSRLPNKPVGPVSVRGAPLNPAPAPGSGAG
jgi:Skp family chaperone for outer membrane proteins